MVDRVEVKFGGNSVEVEPRFYRIAMGILTMGLPIMDVFCGYPGDGPEAVAARAADQASGETEDFVSIVFPDADSLEFFSSFLLTHHLFIDDSSSEPQIRGSLHMEMVDGDLATTYFLCVENEHLPDLEACLVAHTPPGGTGGSNPSMVN